MRNRTLIILIVIVALVAITAYTHSGGGGRLTTFLKSMHGSGPGR
jgi:hypothetical protein